MNNVYALLFSDTFYSRIELVMHVALRVFMNLEIFLKHVNFRIGIFLVMNRGEIAFVIRRIDKVHFISAMKYSLGSKMLLKYKQNFIWRSECGPKIVIMVNISSIPECALRP